VPRFLGKDGRGAGHAGANSGLEVASDPSCDRVGAAIGLEALQIETELLGSLPEVRIVDVAAVAVERVNHLEEAPLRAGRLGGGVQGR
jgi:hypothetical protein